MDIYKIVSHFLGHSNFDLSQSTDCKWVGTLVPKAIIGGGNPMYYHFLPNFWRNGHGQRWQGLKNITIMFSILEFGHINHTIRKVMIGISAGIWRDLEEFEGIWRDLKRFEGIWRDLKGFWGIWRDLKGFEGIWRELKGFEGIWTIDLQITRLLLYQLSYRPYFSAYKYCMCTCDLVWEASLV